MTRKRDAGAARRKTLMAYFSAMSAHFGLCRWWPAQTPFEVAVGAVLTQNTAWTNVEKALNRLREKKALTPDALFRLPRRDLEEALRPSGFYRLKAVRLSNLLVWLASLPGWDPEDASLVPAGRMPTEVLRPALLAVSGIGPETADAILLYAFSRPSFVVDAYTRRILHRHGHLPADSSYADLRNFFMDVLPPDVALFNEYHALIVRTGHSFCKKGAPDCAPCPLGKFCEPAD
ncbi:MAG: endonuclease III domain-containing protein [Desulfovibrio sp.]|nr:endonuclease III domain-containing protein [Desulfovibrio sp.]